MRAFKSANFRAARSEPNSGPALKDGTDILDRCSPSAISRAGRPLLFNTRHVSTTAPGHDVSITPKGIKFASGPSSNAVRTTL